MHFSSITASDLENLRKLQPDGWSDIITDTTYYIKSAFCFPLKVEMENCISGMGVAIIYNNTAWLAHIIVHPDFRNRGLGLQIVNELLDIVKRHHIPTCLLTATEFGKPVYVRAGFETITEYVFLNRENPFPQRATVPEIISYDEQYRHQLLQMDATITAENREPLLSGVMEGSLLYVSEGALQGFYIPGLKEGPVLAISAIAGLELLKIKCVTSERVVLPADNSVAVDFLQQNGFVVSPTKGTRMVLGNDINWQPENIYSRIGGNFG